MSQQHFSFFVWSTNGCRSQSSFRSFDQVVSEGQHSQSLPTSLTLERLPAQLLPLWNWSILQGSTSSSRVSHADREDAARDKTLGTLREFEIKRRDVCHSAWERGWKGDMLNLNMIHVVNNNVDLIEFPS